MQGYLAGAAVVSSDAPFGRVGLAVATALRVRPERSAPPIGLLDPGTEAAVLGRFGAFALVEVEGSRGWVETGGR
jgi:hypothetical protein